MPDAAATTATMTDPTPSSEKLLVWRCSSLSTWSDCELRMAIHSMPWIFQAHGFALSPPKATIAAMIGSAVHAGGEVGLREMMAHGSLSPLSTLEAAAITEFERRKSTEARGKEIVMYEQAPTEDVAKRQIARLTRVLREDVVRVAEPIAVENRLEALIEDGVLLSGKADLLHLDRPRNRTRLRDTKTTRRKAAANVHLAQQGGYSLLFKAFDHPTIDDGQIDQLSVVLPNKPQPPVEELPFNPATAERVAWSVLQDATAKTRRFMREGDPYIFQANPRSWLCNAKFCRAHRCHVCPMTRDQ
jgi:hypothetical protein